jgi:fatty-acyl-CoA synthase
VAYTTLDLSMVCAAFVRVRPGVEVTVAQIIDFCRGKIASFKVPRLVFFVDDFPMTGSGKVQKFRLRELARELM